MGARLLPVLIAAVLLLTGCGALDGLRATRGKDATAPDDLVALVPADDRLNARFVRAGVEAMVRADYIAASRAFSRALKFDPENGQIHFLNALAYHMRAAGGDASQQDLADVGYGLALQFSPTLYEAAAQRGFLRLLQNRDAEAQDDFAYALLFDPKDVTLWLALATASYRAQDLDTATRAVKAAEQLAPDLSALVRTRAIVRAASGLIDEAMQDLARYRASPGADRFDAEQLARRIEDWRDVHRRGLKVIPAQAQRPTPFGPTAPFGPTTPLGPGGPPGPPRIPGQPGAPTTPVAPAPPAAPLKPGRMVLVDVVIIRSEERYTTNRGVNLLEGLTATFAFSDTATRTRTFRQQRAAATTDPIAGFVRTITRTITIPQVTYNINIFNDENDYNEVLARPSLVAVEGKPSDFFTGTIIHVEIQGAAGSVGVVDTIPIGIKLAVTPQFIDDQTVELKVEAGRAFVEGRQEQIGFANFTQTTRTQVTASAVVRFGETLILSGLSERETERIKSGVPILQNIPIVQYLFANETTLDFVKSVLILLTPRPARYTTAPEPSASPAPPPPQPNLEELKGRLDHFKPAPNLDAAFHHLRAVELFKEFRTGDVRVERWMKPFRLNTILRRALKFLYY